MALSVKNWENFQHYKNRTPPWIKLYKSLLDDPEYHSLSPLAAKYLPLIWLAAAEHSTTGDLPAIDKLAFRLHLASKVLAEIITELDHWINRDASIMIARCKQSATPERERERETERENRITRASALDVIDHDFDLFWKAYPKKVGGKRAAIKAFQKARKSGCPSVDALIAAIDKQRKSDQWRRDGGQYIPNPTTWLNQGRWEDVLPEGTGRKLLPQEQTAIMLEEWLAEENEKNGQCIDCEVSTTDFGVLPGKVDTDKTDGIGLERTPRGR